MIDPMTFQPKKALLWALTALPLLLGSSSAAPLAEALTGRKSAAEGGKALFSRVDADASKLQFLNPIDTSLPRAYLYHSPWAAGGVALGDVDGNGLLDIFLSGGPETNGLFLQTSPWNFENIAVKAGVEGGDSWAGGAAMVDIDADNDLDIVVCNYDSPVQCFINDGTGRNFVDRAPEMGLDVTDASLMPFFADYDNDGDLDLYLMTNRYEDPNGKPANPPVEIVDGTTRIKPEFAKYYFLKRTGTNKQEADLTGRPDYLFRNDGPNGSGAVKFKNVTTEVGMTEAGHGLAAIWWDFDRDGWIDIYVANDFNDPDRLYRNNRDGTFGVVTEKHLPQTAWFSMGADIADMNNDGLFDLFTTDMAATTHYKAKISMGNMQDWAWGLVNFWPRQSMRNNFFLNTGTERFMEIAPMTGLASTDWTWGVRLADLDCDGRVDLFFTNGAARYFNNADIPVPPEEQIGKTVWDPFKNGEPLREQNLAYRNLGDLQFENASKEWGLDLVGVSMGAAQGDLDNDGDLDLVVINLGDPVAVYRNDSVKGNVLKVRLQGCGANTRAIGTVVTIESATAGTQPRLANPQTGFQASNDHALHFGLGDDTKVERLTVRWPGGPTEVFEDIDANQLVTLIEPESDVLEKPAEPKPGRRMFENVTAGSGLNFKHKERTFDDFQLQPLLPGKLSQLGGGIAMGDIDRDGDDDLFAAGAAGQSGSLFLQDGDGIFKKAEGDFAWEKYAESEEMAPLWFDVDSDGDLDLFVSTGTSEFPQKSPHQQNRIYLNDSTVDGLRFSETPILTLPMYGGANGASALADFDQDGDLDLFIGGRIVPGEFPMIPESYLLRNDSKPGVVKFTDVTDKSAPGLRKAGMVTGALWSDANGDSTPDLLLTLEWGSVRLFLNRDGALKDATSESGLAERSGWWNSITGGDLDNDGDTDYAVMNVGLNTKYGHPTAKKPSLLYYGDMDGTGKRQLIEAKSDKIEADRLLPVRGRSCSSNAMPFLADKFPTFDSFAKAHLDEIYAPNDLSAALRVEANTFESGLLINDGTGTFEWRPFPRLAQASPGYGVVSTDFNADGSADICAVQNIYSREPETGLWRGGLGLMLAGSPNGIVEMASPADSGMIVPGDGKGLIVCDLGNDGWPDLIATQNNDEMILLRNKGIPKRHSLVVRLVGPPGNMQAAGAKIRVNYSDDSTRHAEIYSGSGYLSQSAPLAFFAKQLEGGVKAVSVTLRWPNGRESAKQIGESPHILFTYEEA